MPKRDGIKSDDVKKSVERVRPTITIKEDSSSSKVKSFTDDLIASLNKERGETVAYNLKRDETPVHVKRWISTGSHLLDYIIANRKDGGLPEGRIVEIFGPPSIGKSHLAIQVARSVQKLGGVAIYIDSENATSVENLINLGVNINERFVYVDEKCTENILSITESTILKAKSMSKNVPIVVIWDSVAGSSPKAELEGDYDKDTIGLQARSISKGMRKITGIIGNENVLFLILNQERAKIGVYAAHGEVTTTPGGKAIPYFSSVRVKLGAGQQIQNSKGDVVGIHVTAKVIKNRVAYPFRSCEFEIHFGKGIREDEQIFDILRSHGKMSMDNMMMEISGMQAWKQFLVINTKTGEEIVSKKFYKNEFKNLMKDPTYESFIFKMLEKAMVKDFSTMFDDVLKSSEES